jgi:hypothetical protein
MRWNTPLPVAGYDYNSGWISFCWRDSHPLEWQLAQLSQLAPATGEAEAEADPEISSRAKLSPDDASPLRLGAGMPLGSLSVPKERGPDLPPSPIHQ